VRRRGDGARFLHVLQPNQYAGSKPMDEAERAIAVAEGHPYAVPTRKGHPFLRAACAGRPGCYDMTDLFADVSEPLYVDQCCHFNERGNAILG
jgi:hypothetical protein